MVLIDSSYINKDFGGFTVIFKIWTSLVAQLVKIHIQCRRQQLDSCVRKIPCRRVRLPTPIFLGFPGDSDGKESACNVQDLGLIPGLEKVP